MFFGDLYVVDDLSGSQERGTELFILKQIGGDYVN